MVMISLFHEQQIPKPPAPLWHSITLAALIALPMLIRPGGHSILWAIREDTLLSYYVLFLMYLFYAAFAVFGFTLNGTDPIAFFRAQFPKNRSLWQDIILGLGVGFLGLTLSIAISLVVRMFAGIPPPSAIGREAIPDDALGFSAELIAGCAAGVNEELVYRGYFFQQISFWTRRFGLSLVLQSILFGLAHGPDYEPAQFFTAVGCGLLFGWVAFKRKSLVPGIIAHAWMNCIVYGVAFVLAHS